MVIQKMIELKNYQTVTKICPTIREDDGLAMSSRNMRLSKEERSKSVEIFKALCFIEQNIRPGDISFLKREAAYRLEKAGFRVEYAEVADTSLLSPVNEWDGSQKLVALIAAFLGEVRLIDNLLLN
jgi:pantoate--beta-alanine ligase